MLAPGGGSCWQENVAEAGPAGSHRVQAGPQPVLFFFFFKEFSAHCPLRVYVEKRSQELYFGTIF